MEENLNVHTGHRTRLRDTIKNGDINKMQDYQLLEYLLTLSIPRKDTNEIAHNLIKQFGSLAGVLDAKPEFLMKVDGMGENSAIFLNTIPKILNKYKLSKQSRNISLKGSLHLISYCLDILEQKTVEEIYLILLDNKLRLIQAVKISSGTINQAFANIREITEIALSNNAVSIALAHNHPTSSPNPSYIDDDFTKKVMTSMLVNGIDVVDHIIVGKDSSYYSYRDHNDIEEFKKQIMK